MKISYFVIGLALFITTAANAYMIDPEWEPKNWPANPARHTMDIKRTAASARQSYMIALAEATYPPREDVIKVWQTKPIPEDVKLWWYADYGIKIPYAITREAIDYYSHLITSHQTKKWNKYYYEPSSSFRYEASVEFKKSYSSEDYTNFANVFVVKMKIHYSISDGGSIGGFAKTREVIINADGKVLKIFGDGITAILMID